MRIDLKNVANFLLNKYLLILLGIFILTIVTSIGLSNFKLDASSDALVLESDESLKTYRETEEQFGDSSFLIVTYEPKDELFSEYSLKKISELERDLTNINGVDSVLSILDAPIFFQPRVGLSKVSDNLKNLTDEDVDSVVKVLKSDWLTQGPNIRDFENAFSKYIGSLSSIGSGLANACQ